MSETTRSKTSTINARTGGGYGFAPGDFLIIDDGSEHARFRHWRIRFSWRWPLVRIWSARYRVVGVERDPCGSSAIEVSRG